MTIALALLARDDAERLPRVLDSAAGVVDSIVVLDSGSTDGSQDICRDYGATVHERAFTTEAEQRGHLLSLAVEQGDYVLTLDSDEELEQHAPLPDLDAPCYMIDVRQQGTRFGMPKLLRSGEPWKYVGGTHAYLAPHRMDERRKLDALTILHHHDRPDQDTKYPEVKRILEDALVKDPADSRSVFYLAQTERGLGNLAHAVALYNLRATMAGFEEEAWYAQFQSARMRCDPEALLSAWRRRPSRYEPLYALAQLASVLADQTPDPEDDILFIHDRDVTYVVPVSPPVEVSSSSS